MRSYCSEWPEFHPEFGLFCPSVRQRRIFRFATLCLMTIMVVGASRVLAAAHRPELEETYLASLGNDEDATPEAAPATPEAEDPVLPRPPDPCAGLGHDDLAGYFLNPSCKLQGRKGQRNNEYRVATYIIGHIEPQPMIPSAATVRIAALEAPIKIGDGDKKAGAEHTASVKKHKPKEAGTIEVAHEVSRPAGGIASRQGMPNPYMSAYTTETKLSRSHGPLDNFGHAPTRQGPNTGGNRTW